MTNYEDLDGNPISEAERNFYIEEEFKDYFYDFNLSSEDIEKPILDVGTSVGGFVHFLREKIGNKKAYGIDISEDMISKLGSEGVIVGTGFELPFKDNTFELVTAKNIIPMFDRKRKTLSFLYELLRVTSTTGKLIFNTSTPESIKREWDQRIEEEPENKIEWEKSRDELAADKQWFMDELGKLIQEGYKVSQEEKPNGRVIITVQK